MDNNAFTECGENQTTLLVCAGVEGAGKTSICGVLRESYNHVLETALTPQDLGQISRARQEGYYIRLLYLGLDTLEDHLHRIHNRVQKGGVSTDLAEVERQFRTRFDSLKKVLTLCHEADFMDNTNGFRKVATYQRGETVITEDGRQCIWLQEWLSYGQ